MTGCWCDGTRIPDSCEGSCNICGVSSSIVVVSSIHSIIKPGFESHLRRLAVPRKLTIGGKVMLFNTSYHYPLIICTIYLLSFLFLHSQVPTFSLSPPLLLRLSLPWHRHITASFKHIWCDNTLLNLLLSLCHTSHTPVHINPRFRFSPAAKLRDESTVGMS